MQEVFEKIIAQFTSIRRVIKNDEDLEWNRAVYKCTEIVRQAAEYNNGWIPCSERLPEEHALYDITFRNSAGIHSDSAIYNPYLKRWLWDADETELVENEVLAWAEKRECCTYERMTNGDKIRSMSDDELAELLYSFQNLEDKVKFCKNKTERDNILDSGKEIPDAMCKQCLVEWLQSEVEE